MCPLPPRGHRSEIVPKSWILALCGYDVKMPDFFEQGHSGRFFKVFQDEIRPPGPFETPGVPMSPLPPRGRRGESVPKRWILASRGSGKNMPGFFVRGHSGRSLETKSGQPVPPETPAEVISALPPRGHRSKSVPKSQILALCGYGVKLPGFFGRGRSGRFFKACRDEMRPLGPSEMPGEPASPLPPSGRYSESVPKRWILASRGSGMNMIGFFERRHSWRSLETKSGQPVRRRCRPKPSRHIRREATAVKVCRNRTFLHNVATA
jgi:hypothetical protein